MQIQSVNNQISFSTQIPWEMLNAATRLRYEAHLKAVAEVEAGIRQAFARLAGDIDQQRQTSPVDIVCEGDLLLFIRQHEDLLQGQRTLLAAMQQRASLGVVMSKPPLGSSSSEGDHRDGGWPSDREGLPSPPS